MIVKIYTTPNQLRQFADAMEKQKQIVLDQIKDADSKKSLEDYEIAVGAKGSNGENIGLLWKPSEGNDPEIEFDENDWTND